MYGTERQRWFRQAYGRDPRDDYELNCAVFQSSWASDGLARALAARVVAYAEAQGGEVLTFARTHWPHYWGLAMPQSLGTVTEEMGISEERTKELLAQIGAAVRGPRPEHLP